MAFRFSSAHTTIRTTFEEAQKAFQKGEIDDFKCAATYGKGKATRRCDEPLTSGQKELLRTRLLKDKHHIDLEELRIIIWELLCSNHQAHQYEEQVESRWRQDFDHIDFTPQRSRSRRSSLSRSPTPTPRKTSAISMSSLLSPSPSPSPLSSRERDTEADYFRQPSSASNVAARNVVQSIEAVDSAAPTSDLSSTSPDISGSASADGDSELLSSNRPYGENSSPPRHWGDSSATVGGEVSKGRTLYVYHHDGQVKKEKSGTQKTSAPRRSRSNDQQPTLDLEIDTAAMNEEDAGLQNAERSSLTPDRGRRTSNYAKSTTRIRGSRSPSIGPLSARGKKAFATMEGDAMFDKDVRTNEENVFRLLRKPLNYTDKKSFGIRGSVYAIRDPELDLVKIGFSRQESGMAQSGHSRFATFLRDCHMSQAAVLVQEVPEVQVLAYKRLEQLVHADLRPHRWYFHCDCGLKTGPYDTEHHEWYDVSNQVALRTIKLWRNFILQGPYGDLQSLGHHELQDRWRQRFDSRPAVAEGERHEHHNRRLLRWAALLQPGSTDDANLSSLPTRQNPEVETKSAESQEIKAEEYEATSTPLYDNPPATDMPPIAPPRSRVAKPAFQLNNEHMSVPSSRSASAASAIHDRNIDIGNNSMFDSATAFPTEPPLNEEQVPATTGLAKGFHLEPTVERGLDSTDVQDFANRDFKAATLIGAIDSLLRKERKGLASRTAYKDIYTFRWSLASAMILAFYSSYVPPMLSALMWFVFLPLFVAELREWT